MSEVTSRTSTIPAASLSAEQRRLAAAVEGTVAEKPLSLRERIEATCGELDAIIVELRPMRRKAARLMSLADAIRESLDETLEEECST